MPLSIRATLWAPEWASQGWAEGSPGFQGPRLSIGTAIATAVAEGSVRVVDVTPRSADEFREWALRLLAAGGCEQGGLPPRQQRFLQPELAASAAVRLTHRSRADIARYLVNY
eukprot:gene5036-54189_t